MIQTVSISTRGKGLHEFTEKVLPIVAAAAQGSLPPDGSGLCTLFIRHTSASLLIQENAAPSARRDLEAWFERHVPESDPLYTHDEEGPDDMPAHIKAAITQTSLSIPIIEGRLALGRWQGIFLWEHRRAPHTREVVVHIS